MAALTELLQARQQGDIRNLVLHGTVALERDLRQCVGGLVAMQGPALQVALDTVADSLGIALCAIAFAATALRRDNRHALAIAVEAWRAEAGGGA